MADDLESSGAGADPSSGDGDATPPTDGTQDASSPPPAAPSGLSPADKAAADQATASDYWRMIGHPGQGWSVQDYAAPRSTAPDPANIVERAFAGVAADRAGNAMAGLAELSNRRPLFEPYYKTYQHFGDLLPDEQKAALHQVVSDPNLTDVDKAFIIRSMRSHGAGDPEMSFDQFAGKPVQEQSLWKAGQSVKDFGATAGHLTPEEENYSVYGISLAKTTRMIADPVIDVGIALTPGGLFTWPLEKAAEKAGKTAETARQNGLSEGQIADQAREHAVIAGLAGVASEVPVAPFARFASPWLQRGVEAVEKTAKDTLVDQGENAADAATAPDNDPDAQYKPSVEGVSESMIKNAVGAALDALSKKKDGGAVRGVTRQAGGDAGAPSTKPMSGWELGRPPRSYGDLLQLAIRFARARLDGRVVTNRETGMPIELAWTRGLKSAVAPGTPPALLLAVPALPALLAKAHYLGAVADPMHRPDIRRLHGFAAAVDIRDHPVKTLIIVRESRTGHCALDRLRAIPAG